MSNRWQPLRVLRVHPRVSKGPGKSLLSPTPPGGSLFVTPLTTSRAPILDLLLLRTFKNLKLEKISTYRNMCIITETCHHHHHDHHHSASAFSSCTPSFWHPSTTACLYPSRTVCRLEALRLYTLHKPHIRYTTRSCHLSSSHNFLCIYL